MFSSGRGTPGEFGLGAAAVFEVFHFDVIFLAGDQGDCAGPFFGRLVDPFVDYQLVVDPEPDAVISGGVKSVGLRVLRLNLTGPADGKSIRTN